MSKKKITHIQEGFAPIRRKKGHQPSQGNIDISKPPRGGSGVPQKPQTDSGKKSNKD